MNNDPNSVKIDLSALAHNLRQIRMLISKDTKIMGIVKSDAYGHGLFKVSQTLEKNGIDCLGVAYLHEALELREKGIKVPVVILCGIHSKDECCEVVGKDLTPVLFDLMMAEILDQESERQGKRTPIHLKVDTGMGRLGISHEDIAPFIKRIMAFENLDIKALTSHLSSADERVSDFTETQIKKFEKAIEVGHSMGLRLPLNNLANSAGIMGYKKAHFEMVRPGIMLYGCLPSPEFKTHVVLNPAMHFKGRILQIRDLPDQTPVSYGRTYYTKGARRLAILSVGYGDGIPRTISNRGSVLIRGNKVPIVGTICMDLSMCDITGLKDVRPGEEVVFLGSQGQETIIGDDIAGWAGTISYEILCSVGQRNKREYIS
ncbi:MAG: alanine racemase [Deltaproteobacteria bacterium]|nr:alanine racemase [Deltaproteobacteria bacterium]